MKAVLINGSPRKNWNTHQLLLEAQRGLEESDVECEMIHLYDYLYTGCKSCFACKLKDNNTGGICILNDDLKEILHKIHESDAIIIGSPIYYNNLTAQSLALIERLLFAMMKYELDDDGKALKIVDKRLEVGLILTMNAPEKFVKMGAATQYEHLHNTLNNILGSRDNQIVYSYETYQFDDYSKYYSGMFDEKQRALRRESQFPIDMENAYKLGKNLLK